MEGFAYGWGYVRELIQCKISCYFFQMRGTLPKIGMVKDLTDAVAKITGVDPMKVRRVFFLVC